MRDRQLREDSGERTLAQSTFACSDVLSLRRSESTSAHPSTALRSGCHAKYTGTHERNAFENRRAPPIVQRRNQRSGFQLSAHVHPDPSGPWRSSRGIRSWHWLRLRHHEPRIRIRRPEAPCSQGSRVNSEGWLAAAWDQSMPSPRPIALAATRAAHAALRSLASFRNTGPGQRNEALRVCDAKRPNLASLRKRHRESDSDTTLAVSARMMRIGTHFNQEHDGANASLQHVSANNRQRAVVAETRREKIVAGAPAI
jgi:hypothetical protein